MKRDSVAGILIKMREEIKKADQYLEVAQKIEEESDYSDAMLSMDRSYCEGFSNGLATAYRLIKEGGAK